MRNITQQLDCTLIDVSYTLDLLNGIISTRYLTVKYEDLVDPDKYLPEN